jgi:hypothetical protein
VVVQILGGLSPTHRAGETGEELRRRLARSRRLETRESRIRDLSGSASGIRLRRHTMQRSQLQRRISKLSLVFLVSPFSLFSLISLVALKPTAAQEPSRLHFPASGFSIEALESPPTALPSQPLVMTLPPTRGFSPNVNVQIQPYAGSAQAYLDLTLRQLGAAKFELIGTPTVDARSMTLEYAGTAGGKDLHWYAKAFKKDNSFFLITATALHAQWGDVSDQLRSVVDSFQLED